MKNRIHRALHPLFIIFLSLGIAAGTLPSSVFAYTTTWTSRTSAGETLVWSDIAWSPSLGIFAAVAQGGVSPVMTSPDGITWTARSSSNDSNVWVSIEWSPTLNLFVAVSFNGTNRVMTSPDGITWTGHASATETNNWRSVVWSPALNLFVAVASAGTNRVMTSPDGITWTARASATETNAWIYVTWSSDLNLFAAVATGGTNRVMTSPDGITWTARASATETNVWRSVVWGGGTANVFVAVSSTGTNRVMTSPDGITWTARTPSDDTNGWNDVTWSPALNVFIAVAVSGTNRVMSSVDGITWVGMPSADETNQWASTAWSSTLGYFAAVSASGTNRAMTSAMPVVSPTVITTTPTQLSLTSQTLAGNVTATGGATVTDRGFEYGLTTSYGTTVSESGSFSTGAYTLTATGLICSTPYFYRAYATNSIGTSYGAATPFTVTECPSSGGGTGSGGRPPDLVVVSTESPAAPISSGSAFQFTKPLKLGMTDIDVFVLQQFLNTHDIQVSETGAGSRGHETSYYGAKTALAVKKFQELHADTVLLPLGLTKSTGIFGVMTMKAVNAILNK